MKRVHLSIATVAVMVFGIAAEAQNTALTPSFGSVEIRSGALDDLGLIALVAGGDRRYVQGDCAGYVADAPDYRVTYTGRAGTPLSFSVHSTSDTILVVNAPDGRWHCSDDVFGLDPALSFDAPLSGQYDIWVGTFNADVLPEASLAILDHWIE